MTSHHHLPPAAGVYRQPRGHSRVFSRGCAMSRKMPQPFSYRNGWRAQVTLKSGARPFSDCATFQEAKEWIADMLALDQNEHTPKLGGPSRATLAQMVTEYAKTVTVAKGGAVQELTRINHYLLPAGLPALALIDNDLGHKEVVTLHDKHALKRARSGDDQIEPGAPRRGGRNAAGITPQGFAAYNEERSRQAHPRTYAHYTLLANKRASQITRGHIRNLQTDMTAEGYSASTIQKEIALLKALFNTAKNDWSWQGFENPYVGIRLKPGNERIVTLSTGQLVRLRQALSEADNPQLWPLVELALTTAMRQSTLLRLRWEDLNFVDRNVKTLGKGVRAHVPLWRPAQDILNGLPGPRTGTIFTITEEAIRAGWSRARERAGLPKDFYFRDLRHVQPTEMARAGMNTLQISQVLGHTSTRQAQVYVNLFSNDIAPAMDERLNTTSAQTPKQLLCQGDSWDVLRAQNKSRRALQRARVTLLPFGPEKPLNR